MSRNHIIISIVVILVVGAVAFWAGTAYGGSQTTTASSARGSFAAGGSYTRGAGGFAGAGTAAGGGTVGSIISVGNSSITVQIGSSTQIVLVSDSTPILKTVSGSMSDLSVGTNVVVTGTSNSDGSLTAQSIQIRPAGMNFGGTGRAGASAQTQSQ